MTYEKMTYGKAIDTIEHIEERTDEVKDYPPYLDIPKKPVYRTNYDRIRNMSVEEMAEFLCDNFDCDVCPAYDENYCPNSNLKICSEAMKKYLESEAI